MKKFVGLLILLFFFFFCIKSECPDHIWTNENEILVYSTQTSTYINAENQCTTYGGKIVRIPNEDRSLFNQIVEELYLQGLVEVKIYNETNVHGNPNENPQRIYDYHKYRADGYSDDEESLDGYDRPGIGDLSSIWLSSSSQSEDINKVQFCYIAPRDLVMRECIISEGWKFNFELYEETDQSNNAIMLYNYYSDPAGATSKLSLNEITDSYWTTDYVDGISSVYLKGISVFIGARSDANQDKWYWNNNTEVNNPLFPEPNSSLCQQMTWPLTYSDGINLRPNQCETGMSNYICSITFSVMLEEVSCNATVLELTWNSFENIANIQTLNMFSLQVKLTSDSSNSITQNFTVGLNQTSVTISNLVQRTNYTAEIIYTSMDCPTWQVAASSSGRTGYGVPNPVTSAYVDNTSNQCTIIWTHDTTENEIESYLIIFRINSTNVDTTVEDELESNMSYVVDLSQFESNETLSFLISSISSCALQSQTSKVKGSCKIPDLPTTTTTSTSTITCSSQCIPKSSLSFEAGIGIGIGIGIAAMLLLAMILKLFRSYPKRSTTETFIKEPVYEIPLNKTHEYSTVIEKRKDVNQITGKKIYENEGMEQVDISKHSKKYENVQSS